MTRLKDIPVVTAPLRSGQKYVTTQGTTAIKDGIKARAATASPASIAASPIRRRS